MTDAITIMKKPASLLLATDLNSRSDRALDRAVALAREWDAALTVLHVIDPAEVRRARHRDRDTPSWRRPPDPVLAIEAALRRDLAGELPNLRVAVREGDVADIVSSFAATEQCDLIITGVASHSLFGRSILGSTVDALIREQTVPVLVVKNRARGPYQSVTIATDFSEASRAGLRVAASWFDDRQLCLFHSFEVPFGQVLDKGNFSETLRDMERLTAEEFLDDPMVPDEARLRIRVLIEYGRPETMLRRYVEDVGTDLIVLGSQGRSMAFEAFVGSTATRLLAELPSDMLVVRGGAT